MPAFGNAANVERSVLAERRLRKMGAMRGFSPKLILGKEVHPLFRDNIEILRNSPNFSAAMRCEAQWVIHEYASNKDPYFAKYIGDVANVLMESSAIYFDLLKKHEHSGAGATLGKLQLVAFVHGYASPRRVTMYVKRLVQDGRLQYSTDGGDRRVRRLVPCEPLIASARNNFAGLMSSCACLCPDAPFVEEGMVWLLGDTQNWTSEQQGFFERICLEMGRRYLQGADPLRPYGDVRHFTSKDAGKFLLFNLILSSMVSGDRPSPNVEFALNYSDAAASTGVSRTHVRNVIEGAEKRGLIVDLGEGGRSMRLTAKMIDAFERYFASLMILTRESFLTAAAQRKQQ